jgi:hypothetical protein
MEEHELRTPVSRSLLRPYEGHDSSRQREPLFASLLGIPSVRSHRRPKSYRLHAQPAVTLVRHHFSVRAPFGFSSTASFLVCGCSPVRAFCLIRGSVITASIREQAHRSGQDKLACVADNGCQERLRSLCDEESQSAHSIYKSKTREPKCSLTGEYEK